MNTHSITKRLPWAVTTALCLACLTLTGHATLLNPSFEAPEIPEEAAPESAPDHYVFFTEGGFDTSGVVEDAGVARTGDQMLQFFANGSDGVDVGFQGYFQNVALNLSAGQQMGVEAWFRSSAGTPMLPGVDARLGIEFRSGITELNRVELTITSDQLSTSEWRLFTVYGSPVGAIDNVNVTIVQDKQISQLSGNSIFFVDDVAFVPEPSTVMLLLCGAGLLLRLHGRRRREPGTTN